MIATGVPNPGGRRLSSGIGILVSAIASGFVSVSDFIAITDKVFFSLCARAKSDETITILQDEYNLSEKDKKLEDNKPKKSFLDKFKKKDIETEEKIQHNNVSKKEAIKRVILKNIEKAGVDTGKELMLQDIALEVLSCSRLIRVLKTPYLYDIETENKENIDIKNQEFEIEKDIKINSILELMPK